MENTLDESEVLRRYAVVLERLCSSRYTMVVTVGVGTSEWSRTEAQDGKPPEPCAFIINEDDKWNGDFVATVSLRDLQLDEAHVRSLINWLRECEPHPTNLLGEALLKSHLVEFEEFSTHVAPVAWARACTGARHTRYGMVFVPAGNDGEARIRFLFHASAILHAVNARLKLEAQEGNVE